MPLANLGRALVSNRLLQMLVALDALLDFVAGSRSALVLVIAGVAHLRILGALNSFHYGPVVANFDTPVFTHIVVVRVRRRREAIRDLNIAVGLQ